MTGSRFLNPSAEPERSNHLDASVQLTSAPRTRRFLRSVLGQFAWYRDRLAAMSAAEIVHRIVETATKQTARRYNGGWEAVQPSGPLAMIPGIRSRIIASSSDLSALITCAAH